MYLFSQNLMVDILMQKNALEQLAKLRADKFIGELQFRCLKDLLKSDERAMKERFLLSK